MINIITYNLETRSFARRRIGEPVASYDPRRNNSEIRLPNFGVNHRGTYKDIRTGDLVTFRSSNGSGVHYRKGSVYHTDGDPDINPDNHSVEFLNNLDKKLNRIQKVKRNTVIGAVAGTGIGAGIGALSTRNTINRVANRHPDWSYDKIRKRANLIKAISITGGGAAGGVLGGVALNKMTKFDLK